MSIDLQTLQAFCSNDPTRPNLHAPFYIGEFTYATDGVIAIRIPGKLTRNPKPRAMRAGPEPLFKRHLFFHPDFLHILGDFTIPAPASISCVECQMLESPDPGCDECSGSGAILEYPAARLSRDGRAFDCRYLAAIAALPEAELCDAPPPNPVDLVNAAAFRFSGGYGLLMPLTKIRSSDLILFPKNMPANDTPTINEQWHEFAKLVLPADATDAQRREMKRAFFGGFAAGFTAALDLANCPNYFDRHARSERYFDEMRGFQVAIEEGGA